MTGQNLISKLRKLRLISGVSAGLVVALIEVMLAVSFAILLFPGKTNAYIPQGIALLLIGALVLNVIYGLFSPFKGVIAGPQANEVAILSLASVQISSVPEIAAEAAYATILAAILVTYFVKGVLFLAVGQLRLGYLIRFLPYPVVGGFLAGSGWLLIVSAMRLMTGFRQDPGSLTELFDGSSLLTWLPGVALAFLLALLTRKVQTSLILPGTLVAAIAAVYVAGIMQGYTVPQAIEMGLLLPRFNSSGFVWPFSFDLISAVQFPLLLDVLSNLASVMIIGSIHYLMNVSSLELQRSRYVDIDKDVQAIGLANIAAALLGGAGGYLSYSVTQVLEKMRQKRVGVSILSAVFLVVFLLFFSELVFLLPVSVLGGLVFFLGLEFLIRWVFTGWRRMPTTDFLVVLLILLVMALFGLLEAIAIGLLMAVVLFVVNYSRINVVKHAITGTDQLSNVDRSPQEQHILVSNGKRIQVFQLQGYIFFGTANTLVEGLLTRLKDITDTSFIIFDFRRVTGIDSSAIFSFVKLKDLIKTRGGVMLFTTVRDEVQAQVERCEVPLYEDDFFRIFQDLDHGIEWCEDHILQGGQTLIPHIPKRLEDQLRPYFENSKQVETFMRFLEMKNLSEGFVLIQQGSPSDDLYFIERGRVSVRLDTGNGDYIRLRTMGSGTVVGEIGQYLNAPRGASVVAESKCEVYRLSSEAILNLTEKHPDVAAAFHRAMAITLAERLNRSNEMVRNLMD